MGLRSQPAETRGHIRIPSSPTSCTAANPTRREHLLTALKSVPDPRHKRGVRYPLAGVLALAVTATIAGARSFTAIGQWAQAATVEDLAAFGLARATAPGESTLRKLFARVDADALDHALGGAAWSSGPDRARFRWMRT